MYECECVLKEMPMPQDKMLVYEEKRVVRGRVRERVRQEHEANECIGVVCGVVVGSVVCVVVWCVW
jgi:hypothetical protein